MRGVIGQVVGRIAGLHEGAHGSIRSAGLDAAVVVGGAGAADAGVPVVPVGNGVPGGLSGLFAFETSVETGGVDEDLIGEKARGGACAEHAVTGEGEKGAE